MKIRAYCFSKCNKHPGFSVGSKKTFWVNSPGQRHSRHHEQAQRRLLKGTGTAAIVLFFYYTKRERWITSVSTG